MSQTQNITKDTYKKLLLNKFLKLNILYTLKNLFSTIHHGELKTLAIDKCWAN